MSKTLKTLLTAGVLVFTIASCNGDRLTLAAQEGDSEPMQFAKQHYKNVCFACHGGTGRGDGPTGKKLTPPPRSFRKQSWQEKTTDEHIKKVILEGGLAVGLNALMAANVVPRVEEDEEVLDALVKIVRSFGR